MSAFAVLFTPFALPDFETFDRVMQLMSHRGPDGYDNMKRSNVIFGHWHFWVTPEEQGERQPITKMDAPFTIVFDGRIDNREEIFDRLSVISPERGAISDASLILMAYERWREDGFKYFVGEFALVIFDERQNKLICARDPLGERTLFYATHGARTVIASEPWAVANASHPVLNERSAIHYLAIQGLENNETMFEDVYEIPPAHVMTILGTNCSFTCYWYPELDRKIRYKNDTEYGEQFLDILSQSVCSRTRSITPLGALVSGGLDSPSVVAIAAEELSPRSLTTFTHVFDEESLQVCDERKYVNEMAERFCLRSIQIPCDDAWVLKEWQKLPVNPSHPDINAYRWMKEREYGRVHDEGIRVLLTGSFGDTLYASGIEWLVDLLAEGKIGQAVQEILWLLRYAGWRRNRRAGYFQTAVKYLFERLPFVNRFAHNSPWPVWLSQYAMSHILEGKPVVHPEMKRAETLLESWIANHQAIEACYASHHQVELRYPYRDRRLVEFVLALPAYQLHYHGMYKHIIRSVMKGKLPESIRTRQDITSLTPFFLFGMKKEEENIKQNMRDINAPWRPFIDSDWANSYNGVDQHAPVTIPWLLISYSRWARTVFAN